jgi:hypothetical protein
MMGKNEKTPIMVNEKEFFFEDMTKEQQLMVNHISDLDRKLESARFNVDQLSVGREAFVNMLVAALAAPKDDAGDSAQVVN